MTQNSESTGDALFYQRETATTVFEVDDSFAVRVIDDVRRQSEMKRYGTIESNDSQRSLSREAWMSYIASTPDLVQSEPRTGRNPANGKPVLLRPPADTVHLVYDGKRLATFSWGPPEHDCINVQYDDAGEAMVAGRANTIADLLGGAYRRYG